MIKWRSHVFNWEFCWHFFCVWLGPKQFHWYVHIFDKLKYQTCSPFSYLSVEMVNSSMVLSFSAHVFYLNSLLDALIGIFIKKTFSTNSRLWVYVQVLANGNRWKYPVWLAILVQQKINNNFISVGFFSDLYWPVNLINFEIRQPIFSSFLQFYPSLEVTLTSRLTTYSKDWLPVCEHFSRVIYPRCEQSPRRMRQIY